MSIEKRVLNGDDNFTERSLSQRLEEGDGCKIGQRKRTRGKLKKEEVVKEGRGNSKRNVRTEEWRERMKIEIGKE